MLLTYTVLLSMDEKLMELKIVLPINVALSFFSVFLYVCIFTNDILLFFIYIKKPFTTVISKHT